MAIKEDSQILGKKSEKEITNFSFLSAIKNIQKLKKNEVSIVMVPNTPFPKPTFEG